MHTRLANYITLNEESGPLTCHFSSFHHNSFQLISHHSQRGLHGPTNLYEGVRGNKGFCPKTHDCEPVCLHFDLFWSFKRVVYSDIPKHPSKRFAHSLQCLEITSVKHPRFGVEFFVAHVDRMPILLTLGLVQHIVDFSPCPFIGEIVGHSTSHHRTLRTSLLHLYNVINTQNHSSGLCCACNCLFYYSERLNNALLIQISTQIIIIVICDVDSISFDRTL